MLNKFALVSLIKKNSIRDARTPQPGEICFNTMTYRSSVTVQRYFQTSVSYIKVQTRGSLAKKKIMFLLCKNKASRKGYKGEC